MRYTRTAKKPNPNAGHFTFLLFVGHYDSAAARWTMRIPVARNSLILRQLHNDNADWTLKNKRSLKTDKTLRIIKFNKIWRSGFPRIIKPTKYTTMTNFMDGGSVSTFTAQFIALGQAQNANSNGVKSRYIMLGLKNKKSFIGKVQKIMLFEGDDFTSDVYELLKKYSTPSQSHAGGFDVNISAFKNSDEFKADPERWGLLLNYPGGMTIEYKFAKGLCYANNIDGQPVVDKLGNHVMKDSVSVFCQVDFYTPGENGTMVPHYIEPYSPSTQGQRIESKFFMTAVSQNDNDGIYVAPAQQPTAQPTQQAAAPQAAAQPTAPVQGNAAGAAPVMPF